MDSILELAKKFNEPICIGQAIGAGDQMMRVWLYPDGTHKVLPLGDDPAWQQLNHVRDAVRENP